MPHTETYRVILEKEQFVFCSAHFITFAGNICEPLHGHNYQVRAELTGPLDENSYVVDFIAARDALLEITHRLDHRVLLPTQHKTIHVTHDDHSVEARFEDRRWVFPLQDCVLLPIANTTAELLARWIGQEFLSLLKTKTGFTPHRLAIAVDECRGQWGEWIWEG